jgi:ribosome-binding ATPase
MNLKVGIVGLPNVGKSTLFNALLKKQVAFAANYPFATVEPNVGVVPVPDERLEKLARVIAGSVRDNSIASRQQEGSLDSARDDTHRSLPPIVPAVVDFVDIAGLVKGASKGEGLGNKFLAHIREVNVICHVVRDFNDSNVVQTGSGRVEDDWQTVELELQLADLETLMKQKPPKGKMEKVEVVRWQAIEKLKAGLEEGVSAREVSLTEDEVEASRDLMLLTAKRVIMVVNVGEDDVRLKDGGGGDMLIICAKMEEDLAGFNDEERKEYLTTAGVVETGLEKLIRVAYESLDLISFLTAGEIEVRAWTIKRGTKAPQAAAVIHTDFEKKFIKAKCVNYEDFLKYDGWKGASEAGKVRIEGKEYVVKEGDVIEYMVGS